MGNCLVTKIKGSVDNDDLKKFGVVYANIKASAQINCSCIFSSSTGTTIRAIGGVFIENDQEVTEITIPANTQKYVYVKENTDFKVEITNKYDLTFVAAGGAWCFDIEDLIFSADLTRLSCNAGAFGHFDGSLLTDLQIITLSSTDEITGNIETLRNAPLTRALINANANIEGNIETWANMSTLSELNIYNSPKITGDAMIFADSSKFMGLTTLDLRGCTGITNRTTEIKALIEAAHPGIIVNL